MAHFLEVPEVTCGHGIHHQMPGSDPVFHFAVRHGGHGIGVDRAAALADHVAIAMAEGGGYPGREVTELKDGRAVYAWWEGEE